MSISHAGSRCVPQVARELVAAAARDRAAAAREGVALKPEVQVSIVVRFPTSNITKDQYAAVRRELEESGSWPADGCQLHVSFGDEDDIQVSEIWESGEKFEAFSKKLGPLMEEAGISLTGVPEVFEARTLEVF